MTILERAEVLFFLLVRPLLLCKPGANRQVEIMLLFQMLNFNMSMDTCE